MGDNYVWRGGVSGSWNLASNWNDTTTNTNPASVAPGSNDLVSITAASGITDVITGTGSSSSLTTSGSVSLAGQFTTGSLSATGGLTLGSGYSLGVTGAAAIGNATTLSIGAGTLTVGTNLTQASNDTVQIGSGQLTIGGNLTANDTNYTVGAGGKLAVTGNVGDAYYYSSYSINGGTFTVGGTLNSRTTSIGATSGGKVQLANLAFGAVGNGNLSATLSADGTSSLEIGTAGGAALGAVTIDAGVTVTESASFTAPSIVNNGTVIVENGGFSTGTGPANGLISLSGTLSGSGQFQIGSNAQLMVGAVSAGSANSISFVGTSGILSLSSTSLNSTNFVPTISGFGSSDAIDYTGAVTAANYNSGVLTLLNGSTTVATLHLTGNYAGQTFLATPVNSSITQINVLGGGDTSTPPAGTNTADQYVWIGPIAGSWDAASNWKDTTTNTNPASLAPGSNDLVSITAASGIVDVITGKGNSSSLTTSGSVSLAGQFTTGSLSATGGLTLGSGYSLGVTGAAAIGNATTLSIGAGTLTVGTNLTQVSNDTVQIGSGQLTIGGNLTANDTNYTVGAGGKLAVTGNVGDAYYYSSYSINGGTFTVGGTLNSRTTSIGATSGGKVQLANLAFGAVGNGNLSTTLSADGTSSLEIGTAGGAALGAVTIDAGVTVTESASFTAPSIVNNGTVIVENGGFSTGTGPANGLISLSGTLSGSGQFQIGSNAQLMVGAVSAGSANSISFVGTSGILSLSSTSLNSTNFVPTISGFGSSDAIDYTGAVTAANYNSGVLTLLNGSTTVATLHLTGNYAGQTFLATPVNSSITQINVLGGGDTSTPPAGTNTADQYVWIGPIAGSWDAASNWKDTTTNTNPASLAPGSNDLVSITAASGIVDVITGKGNSSSLTTSGSVSLAGQFTTGSLSATGGLTLGSGYSLGVTGAAAIGNATTLSIGAGTLTVGTNLTQVSNDTVQIGSGQLTIGGNLTANDTNYTVGAGGKLAVTGNVGDAYYYSSYSINGGTFTVGGTLNSRTTSIGATSGGKVQLANLAFGAVGNGNLSTTLSADGTSSLEIGTAGGAALGAVTIDAGVTVTESASFTAPSIVNNGTVIVENGGFSTGTGPANGLISLSGTLSGSGQFQIGSNAQLMVGAVSNASTNSISFAGANGILAISSTSLNSANFAPTIAGFGSSDAIDYTGAVTAANYNSGVLTLVNGSTTVATLHLTGNYAGETFLTTALSGGITQISLYQGAGNVPPVVTVPGQQTVDVGVASAVSGVSIADSTPGVAISVALSDADGLLTANTGAANGGGTITGSGTKNLTISGTLAQVNADLSTLKYQGIAVGSDSILVAANDGLGGVTSAQIAATISSPQVTVQTASGIDLRWGPLYNEMANSPIGAGGTATQYTCVDSGAYNGQSAAIKFVVNGTGFTYSGSFPTIQLTGGTITSVQETDSSNNVLATFTGLAIVATTFQSAMNTYTSGGSSNASGLNAIFLAPAYQVTGGAGPDKLQGGNLNDSFVASTGNDTVNGGTGSNTADYSSLTTPGLFAVIQGGIGTVQKGGANGTDTLTVGVQNIVDTGTGRSNGDVFDVDAGENVTANSANFNYLIELSTNVNLAYGTNFTGITEFVANTGTNTVNFAADTHFAYVFGSTGNDTLTLGTGGGYLFGEGGTNVLNGGANATNIFEGGSGGTDTMNGGTGTASNFYYVDGSDTINGAGAFNAMIELVAGVTVQLGSATYQHVQEFVSDGGTNVVTVANTDADFVYLYGGAGTDTLSTGSGGGYLFGEGGTNTLTGGGGLNVFVADGASGVDTMNGGTGSNVYYIDANSTVHGAGTFNNVIELQQNVSLALGSAQLGSNVQEVVLNGGTNSVDFHTATSQVFLYGAAGNDTLFGGTGNDFLYGGAGTNTFTFGAGWGKDTIGDWTTGTSDQIDLTALAGAGVHAVTDLTQTITGGNDVITSSHTGTNSITLRGVNSALTASSFHFA